MYTFIYKSIKKKTYWYKQWVNLGNKYNLSIETNNRRTLVSQTDEMLKLKVKDYWIKIYDKLNNNSRHSLYRDLTLTYPTSKSINLNSISTRDMGWAIKARGELLTLNCKKKDQEDRNCTLCNMQIPEDVFHFVAICPILAEHRRNWFGRNTLMPLEFINILQVEYFKLAKFSSEAMNWRAQYVC
jgi:hypothetical protein